MLCRNSGRRAFTLSEVLIAAVLILLLLLLFLPVVKRNRELTHSPRGGNTVAAELSRVESAKAQFSMPPITA